MGRLGLPNTNMPELTKPKQDRPYPTPTHRNSADLNLTCLTIEQRALQRLTSEKRFGSSLLVLALDDWNFQIFVLLASDVLQANEICVRDTFRDAAL